jgi:methyltransferase
MNALALGVLCFVTLQRVGELAWSARNTAMLRACGAVERGRGHYPLIVGVHVAWLAGLWLLAHEAPEPGWLAVFGVLQLGRLWVLATLGWRWSTRVLVLPGEAPIARGPYRFLAHPNYAIVAAEIAVLPLAFGLPLFALLFSLLNALVLVLRIRVENAALAEAAGG